jgi:hypothetical protein
MFTTAILPLPPVWADPLCNRIIDLALKSPQFERKVWRTYAQSTSDKGLRGKVREPNELGDRLALGTCVKASVLR